MSLDLLLQTPDCFINKVGLWGVLGIRLGKSPIHWHRTFMSVKETSQ